MSGGPDDSHLLGLEIFTGGKNQPKDYHAMFTHDFFVEWFADLLDEIETYNKYGVIIAMDNAKYHRCLPADTPKGNARKQQLVEACTKYGLPVERSATKAILWAQLKAYIQANVKSVIENMAMERGHMVAWTPPYHSDLQPIELVWANVKGAVGRQYTSTTSFADVFERLKTAFAQLSSNDIYSTIKHTEGKVAALSTYLVELDECDDETGDTSSARNDSDCEMNYPDDDTIDYDSTDSDTE
ncbi:hypothetical protein ACHHYP_14045 [Achlya hypogyna]|uniref:Tc1-like transposase DDE domain-containing protein n=1 Tax=Achlya hypogyna TaxID=1202772 RepID=A0A1V9YE49_ACHHY|nr:hypothetical protein ACHHYP_14045 [Achlya hypogyna]